MNLRYLLAGIIILFVGRSLLFRPTVWRTDIVAPEDPLQGPVAPSLQPWNVGEYTITPLASFEATVRVLLRDRYYFGDAAELSPLDLSVGWGRMSHSGVLTNLRLSHSQRYYSYSFEVPPIPLREIVSHSANWHLVPADTTVRKKLLAFPVDSIVWLKGYLIRINHPSGWHWQSSLTRDDAGAGACELFWVAEARKEA